ncbi:MAG: MFS transporter [Desulfovibrio sp.]|nr:MFS transporter [Desulfovibrio sp.]
MAVLAAAAVLAFVTGLAELVVNIRTVEDAITCPQVPAQSFMCKAAPAGRNIGEDMFYGWKISLLSMSGNFMLQGSVLYCMNAFMEPLCTAYGWTRAEINISMAAASLVGQLAMPVAASLSSRYSLRKLMAAGALVGGLATILQGMTGNIMLFTLLLTIAWSATQICGGVVGNALVSNWFHYFRGRAFGMVNAGTSLSGVVLPLVTMVLINHFGVGTAYLVIGLLTCALAPMAWMLVRDTPQTMHLHPDGRKHDPIMGHKRPAPDTSLKGLLHSPRAYCMGMAFGLALMVSSSVMSQMKPRFVDLGIAPYPAMLLACSAALCAALGKYAWGWACDRFTPLAAAHGIMLACALSLCLGFLPANLWSMTVFSLSFGLCVGGLWTVLPAVVSYYYGSGNFLPSYKFVSIFIVLRCVGYPIMGYSYELTGGYGAADAGFVVLLLLSLGLSMYLREGDAVEAAARRGHSRKR